MKRVVRVPAVSNKMADIPHDDYSWRKYGQKPIKGSPHPRCVFSIKFRMESNGVNSRPKFQLFF